MFQKKFTYQKQKKQNQKVSNQSKFRIDLSFESI